MAGMWMYRQPRFSLPLDLRIKIIDESFKARFLGGPGWNSSNATVDNLSKAKQKPGTIGASPGWPDYHAEEDANGPVLQPARNPIIRCRC